MLKSEPSHGITKERRETIGYKKFIIHRNKTNAEQGKYRFDSTVFYRLVELSNEFNKVSTFDICFISDLAIANHSILFLFRYSAKSTEISTCTYY